MLRTIKELFGYNLRALDGVIGECSDFLFDEAYWSVRYMVADTGGWLSGRKVLVSPESFGEPDWSSGVFPVRLSKKEFEEAPPLDAHAPVSRRYEKKLLSHLGHSHYWLSGAGPGPGYLMPGASLQTAFLSSASSSSEGESQEKDDADDDERICLRSVSEVLGYQINARGDHFGKVAGFIVDDASWRIRYMVVNTGGWFSGKQVLVSPDWIESISWSERDVVMNIVKSTIEECPVYDADQPVNREYEQVLYDYHGKPHYWE